MTITTSPVPSEPNRVYVSFAYDPELVAKVKAIPGAKWNPTQKAWSVSKRYQNRIDELSPPKKEPTTDEFKKLFGSRMSEFQAACPLFKVTAVYGHNNCHVDIASAVPLPSIEAAFPFEKRSTRGYDLDLRKPAEIDLAIAALKAIGPAEKAAADKVAAEKRAEEDRLLEEKREIRRQRDAEEAQLRREARARPSGAPTHQPYVPRPPRGERVAVQCLHPHKHRRPALSDYPTRQISAGPPLKPSLLPVSLHHDPRSFSPSYLDHWFSPATVVIVE